MTAGIYKITNTLNGKVYIGKSINIEARFRSHKWALRQENNKDRKANTLLFYAVKKHGIENFTFEIIEELTISISIKDREYLSEREIYYIDLFECCSRDKGYNLRRDSPTILELSQMQKEAMSNLMSGENNPNFGHRWSEEQKEAMSIIKKRQIEEGLYDWMRSGEWRKKLSDNSKRLWKDEDKKKQMAIRVAEATSKLRFYEYDKNTMELKRVWESMNEILQEHPDFHRISIYSVCNGHKKSYRGSVWRSEQKV